MSLWTRFLDVVRPKRDYHGTYPRVEENVSFAEAERLQEIVQLTTCPGGEYCPWEPYNDDDLRHHVDECGFPRKQAEGDVLET